MVRVSSPISARSRRSVPTNRQGREIRFPRFRPSDLLRNSIFGFGVSPKGFRLFLALLLIFLYQFGRYTNTAQGSSSASLQRPGSTKPVRPSPWGRYRKLARARGVDGVDYIEFESKALKDQEKQPAPDGQLPPESTPVLAESNNSLADLSSNPETDHGVAHCSNVDIEVVVVRAPETFELFLGAVPSFYTLHEHVRERGPPSGGSII